MRLKTLFLPLVVPCLYQTAIAIQLDIDNSDSVKTACSKIVRNVLTFYSGDKPGGIPGTLPKPYFWWQAGALWGELIEYWSYSGDSKYNDLVMQAMQFQVGGNKAFMPENVTKEEGNDDQAFWAFSAISAAELNFPDPPAGKPSWLALAQAVFNLQVGRWDTLYCGGGLRWQIFFANPGYDYKNTISNGAFFQLAARLGRYTGNETYSAWAERMWDWMASTPNLTPDYQVNDGSAIRYNCTDTNHDQWSYNYGTMIMGSAYMYTITNGERQHKWKTRVDGLIDKFFERFFPRTVNGHPTSENVMVEIQCEPKKTCNPDQTSFKAYVSRWLAVTTQLCPWTATKIMPKLRASAQGAARQCSGLDTGDWCGLDWNADVWDGLHGVGEQMSALAVIGSMMVDKGARGPTTARTGGTSESDPNAGIDKVPEQHWRKITMGDRAGAWILAVTTVSGTVGLAWWMVGD